MATCSCNIGFGNTGKANCEPIQDVTAKLFFVNKFADDGTKNSIPVNTVIDDAYLTARLNDTDTSKRWYPTRPLVGVVDERADPTTESIDGIDYVTEEGNRTFQGFSIKTDSVYLSKIAQGKCGEFSVFVVDKSNRIIGEISKDGTELYPLAIEEGTYWVRLVKTTQSTVQKTEINFTYSKLVSDEDLRLMEAEADLINATGLLDVSAEASAISTTGFVVDLTLDYGYANNPFEVTGWLEADFLLYNITQDAAVVITSTTESPQGTYTFVFPAQASSDVLRLTDAKDGFELYQEITIP